MKQQDDAVIAGGGVIGLACAWRAARRGLRVRVIERAESVATGATGVAAGMLAPVGEATWGEEALLELGLASMSMWDDFAAELERESGRPAGYGRVGALHVALDRDEAAELGRRSELHAKLELDSRPLHPSECRELEPGLATGVASGLHAPHEGAADPVALSKALAAGIEALGGTVELGTEVSGARFGPDGVELTLTGGRTVSASRLVVATGCWSGSAEWLPPELRPPVRPVKGEILTLRGTGDPVCERIVAGERIYIVPRTDGRLLVGATVEERGFNTTVTAGGVHELLREAYRVLPDVAELELVEARAGLRPGSPDNAPLIGAAQGEPAVIFATGHYRNGVLLAPVTSEAVAALLAAEPPPTDIERFRPGRFVTGGAAPTDARDAAVAG